MKARRASVIKSGAQDVIFDKPHKQNITSLAPKQSTLDSAINFASNHA